MDITATSGPGGIGGSLAADRAQASVDKDAFLKLLVAQISNQDPLAPQETDQYMQQITQFSTLEQMMNLNEGVENLALGQLSNNSQEALRFVGRQVVARGSELTLEDEGIVPIRYESDPAAETVTMTIFDASGEAVREVELDGGRGGGTWSWDGTDDDGQPMPAGRYTVSIAAEDAEGDPLSADTYLRGTVSGVRFDNGYPELMIGDRRMRMSDVIEVND